MHPLSWIITSTFVISLLSFVGVLTLVLKEKWLEKILLTLVSLASGALMGGAFLHLLPEAVEKADSRIFDRQHRFNDQQRDGDRQSQLLAI